MLSPENFFNALKNRDFSFFTGVPDSLLKSLCAFIDDTLTPSQHIIAANEGCAIGLGIGYHLSTGKVPVIYLQNSGLGNTINPLLSLADTDIYSIPLLLLIGWRGQPGVKDEPQHIKQGKVMLNMLQAMQIPSLILNKDLTQAEYQLDEIKDYFKKYSSPFALIVEKDSFETYSVKKPVIADRLTREETIEIIIDNLPSNALVIATTGMSSRELFELKQKKQLNQNTDFLTIGGMGHASQIALGVALNQPHRPVYCLDGDGALLMHLGGMATIGQQGCKNFYHILLNNEVHDSVGGQATAIKDISPSQLAKAMGYSHQLSAYQKPDIQSQLQALHSLSGPVFLELLIKSGARKDLGRPTVSPVQNKINFMNSLQCE